MKHKISILTGLGLLTLCAIGCSDILDRPSLTTAEDASFWTSAEKVNIYVNDVYPEYFIGYGKGWSVGGAAGTFSFSDDIVVKGTQGGFGRTVPNETGWSFTHVRKANILIDRLEGMKEKKLISDPDYKHYSGIGHFFRGWEFASLTRTYGDVPYFDHVVQSNETDELFKDRQPRDEVFDHVLEDFDYALANVKLSDGGKTRLNRYSVATIISRLVMFEASWQKYYYHNDARAKKLFEYAAAAAEVVMNSGKYKFDTDYRTLFGCEGNIKGSEVLLQRLYNPALSVTHCRASYCNMEEGFTWGANLDFVKSVLCNDGKVWQNSAAGNTGKFDMPNLLVTRDPRFEATFYHKPTPKNLASNLYCVKFIPRSGLDYLSKEGTSPIEKWKSLNNTNSYPVLRYAETVLNYIECKAEIETLGGPAVTQDDLDRSINAIRKRPLANEAEAMGVKQTAPLLLGSLPDDPARDPSVPPMLWEIRRERRIEFFNEYITRIDDLKRWHKLEYMDTDTREDLLRGIWVNVAEEMPKELQDKAGSGNVGKLRVQKENGDFVTYDGKNGKELQGYFYPEKNQPRLPYLDLPNINLYLSPMGFNTMNFYKERGYTLTQTEGWPDEQ